ncbi:MEMO1 family protein [Methanocella sp. MCL-LM]|uniref:MEMO1 family protein n=1 Tax=Methanocella sp. MCL-LM TaxID=3412035 RepID=UPI003C7301A2
MRRPAVAGQFYPGSEKEVRSLIARLAPAEQREKIKACGIVVPHAGYIYSGGVAADVYASIRGAPTFVLLGPSHYGVGSPVAVSTQPWETPLGPVDIDEDFVKLLDGIIDRDEVAHQSEHSIEVQVPFLQYFFKDFKIVPICLGMQDYDSVKEVATELISALGKYDRQVVIVASSDFTHYEHVSVAKQKDTTLIKDIEKLDVPAFYDDLYRLNATACGYGPIATAMMVCGARGASKARLVKYATSGDVTGDSQVVGYAGMTIV